MSNRQALVDFYHRPIALGTQRGYGIDMMTKRLYVRVCSRPMRDLARGYSYRMGCFGDEDQAEAGLSGYEIGDRVDAECIEIAVEELHERMGVVGPLAPSARLRGRDRVSYLAIFEGVDRGGGPDGEALFHPTKLVNKIATRDIRSMEHAVELVAEACKGWESK